MATVAPYMTTPKVKTAVAPPPPQNRVGAINPTALAPGALAGYAHAFGGSIVTPPKSGGTSTPPKPAVPAPVPPKPGTPTPTAPKPGTPAPTQPGLNPMQPWTPTPFNQTPYYNPPTNAPTPANPSGAFNQYLGNDPNLFKPEAYKDNDAMTPNYLSQMIPLWQLQQNAYQYGQDSNQAAYQFNVQQQAQRQNDIFQQQLATQQQNSAQWQANQAAQQWQQQFGQTQKTDDWSHQLAQGQLADQQRQTANTGVYQTGLINNQNYANITDRNAQQATQAYQQGLIGNQANLNAAQAQYWQGQNANDAYQNQATARYQSGLVGNQAQANTIQQQYNQGQLGLGQGQLSLAQLTQRQQNQFLYAQLQQQAQQAAAERANQLAITNAQVYGRSGAAPLPQWARQWA